MSGEDLGALFRLRDRAVYQERNANFLRECAISDILNEMFREFSEANQYNLVFDVF